MDGCFKLTPRAKEDLRSIWRYTRDIWGEPQADKYLFEVYERFQWLAERPRAGKHRADIMEGYFCFPQGSHLIFYLIHDNYVSIIGVLHKEMDIWNYFEK